MIYLLLVILALLMGGFFPISLWLLVVILGVWTRWSWKMLMGWAFVVGIFDAVIRVHPLGLVSLLFVITVLLMRVGYEQFAEHMGMTSVVIGMVMQLVYWILLGMVFNWMDLLVWFLALIGGVFVMHYFSTGEGVYLKGEK